MNRPSAAEDRRVLSRELSVFLVQFSISLNNAKAYPPDHPSLNASVEAAVSRLTALLRERTALTIGIARNQLIIDGTPTDPRNPVLRELAIKLHRHQLGALRFDRGTTVDEFADMLQALSVEAGRGGQPLGLSSPAELVRWLNIRLEPLEFDHLEISETDEPLPAEGQAAQLWLGLAAAAMSDSTEGTGSPALPNSSAPEEIAKAINKRARDATYDRAIVEYMLSLGSLLGETKGAEATALKQRLTSLLEALDPSVLSLVLRMGGDLGKQRKLVTDASHVLPVHAVLDLLKAAAEASQQNISHSVLRILTKFASHADTGGAPLGVATDGALRDTVRQLMTGWNLEDPNPAKHRRLLELLTKPAVSQAPVTDRPVGEAEAIRVVKMSLETGVAGETVWQSVDEMVEQGDLSQLLDLLVNVENPDAVVDAFWRHLASPSILRRLLTDETQDLQVVERLIGQMGIGAAESLLDALEVSESLAVRRRLLSWLGKLGPDVGALAVPRLPGKPWYIQRNLLLLLGDQKTWPADFTPASYASHPDVRVRREALKLMLRSPDLFEGGITRALNDVDAGIIRMGLNAALQSCPAPVLQRVLGQLKQHYRDPEVRLLAIRLLSHHAVPEARDWLLQQVVARSRWFRRRQLVSKSPELLAALAALATSWASDPAVAAALQLAGASTDPELRAAIRPQGPAA